MPGSSRKAEACQCPCVVLHAPSLPSRQVRAWSPGDACTPGVEAPALVTHPGPQGMFGGICYCRVAKPVLTNTVWDVCVALGGSCQSAEV